MGFIADIFIILFWIVIEFWPILLVGFLLFLAGKYFRKHPNNKPHFLDE